MTIQDRDELLAKAKSTAMAESEYKKLYDAIFIVWEMSLREAAGGDGRVGIRSPRPSQTAAKSKYERWRRKCSLNGCCPRCGDPCLPYAQCEYHRRYKREWARARRLPRPLALA